MGSILGREGSRIGACLGARLDGRVRVSPEGSLGHRLGFRLLRELLQIERRGFFPAFA
jgi:hypothetical protein